MKRRPLIYITCVNVCSLTYQHMNAYDVAILTCKIKWCATKLLSSVDVGPTLN